MPQRVTNIPGIGEVVLAKRRGTRNIRLSVSAAGKVRVGLPSWLSYSAGVEFAKRRQDWINERLADHRPHLLIDGGRVGKSYRLRYTHNPKASKTTTRLVGQTINISSHHQLTDDSVQKAARQASERAIKKEAEKLLPERLDRLSKQHLLSYSSVKIKRLASRWGSCSSNKVITLNFFLMQLPWPLIDYVLIHELVHTKHLNHSPSFWADFERIHPDAKATRNVLKKYRPVINTIS
jgi:predicted metal-dependent hydrolase